MNEKHTIAHIFLFVFIIIRLNVLLMHILTDILRKMRILWLSIRNKEYLIMIYVRGRAYQKPTLYIDIRQMCTL